MVQNELIIEAQDCTQIEASNQIDEILNYYIKEFPSPSVFHVSSVYNKAREQVFSFDYNDRHWWSGRYIGSVQFEYHKQPVLIRITPRFGNTILLKMFSELFNIQFASGSSAFIVDNNSYYLKILIAFVWLQKLSNCNRHGLPKIKTTKRHCSFNIKGKLVVGQSAVTHQASGKIISENREKELDISIMRILYQAYHILKTNYGLGELIMPPNAQESINVLDENMSDYSIISKDEYESIRYHPIYQNYKDLVDFSWQIIKANNSSNEDSNRTHMGGFFLDMAEIWECYVRNHLSRMLAPYGWQSTLSKYEVYAGSFYRRNIIPDIVLKKNEKYMIFDAKYKEMKYRKDDLDMADFFQIHTYISYLQTKGDVVLGGLIYPVTMQKAVGDTGQSRASLWESEMTSFIVDGPFIKEDDIDFEKLKSCLEGIVKNYY